MAACGSNIQNVCVHVDTDLKLFEIFEYLFYIVLYCKDLLS